MLISHMVKSSSVQESTEALGLSIVRGCLYMFARHRSRHTDFLLRRWLSVAQQSYKFCPWGIQVLWYHRECLWPPDFIWFSTCETSPPEPRYIYTILDIWCGIVVRSDHSSEVFKLQSLFQVSIVDFDGAIGLDYAFQILSLLWIPSSDILRSKFILINYFVPVCSLSKSLDVCINICVVLTVAYPTVSFKLSIWFGWLFLNSWTWQLTNDMHNKI